MRFFACALVYEEGSNPKLCLGLGLAPRATWEGAGRRAIVVLRPDRRKEQRPLAPVARNVKGKRLVGRRGVPLRLNQRNEAHMRQGLVPHPPVRPALCPHCQR